MKKKYYFPNGNPDAWYGSTNPVCVDYEEADFLCREFSDPWEIPLSVENDWHEADAEEIKKYGTYDS